MIHSELIKLLSKDKLNKQEKHFIEHCIEDSSYIESFYTNDEYLNVRKFTTIPSLFTKVLHFSISLAKLVQNKEVVDFNEIKTALFINKEINSLKKLNEIFTVSVDNIKSLFEKDSVNHSTIHYISKNNISLALDIFKHYQHTFSEKEFKEIDVAIKTKLVESLYFYGDKPDSKTMKIIKDYPFYRTDGLHDQKSTWALLVHACVYNNQIKTAGKFKELCNTVKIDKEAIPDFLFYILFESNYQTIENLTTLLETHTEKNLKIENLLQPLLENNNLKHDSFLFNNKFLSLQLPYLLKHFDNDSFLNLNLKPDESNPKNIVLFSHLIRDTFTPVISFEDKVAYLNMMVYSHTGENIIGTRYKPEKVLLLLKSLNEKEIKQLKDIFNINAFYDYHNFIFRDKNKESLIASRNLVKFMVNHHIYPNTNLNTLRNGGIDIIDSILDEEAKTHLIEQKNNEMFFLPFIKEAISKDSSKKHDSMDFYINRENFIKDFLNSQSFVYKALSLFTESQREHFKHVIFPSVEKNYLDNLISEEIPIPKSKKRL